MNPTPPALLFVLLPFLVSGAFWLSPWVGWPAAVVLGIIWVGAMARILKGTK